MKKMILYVLFLLWITTTAAAQTVSPVPQYGESINLEMAKKLVSAGQTYSKTKQWPMAIAIVDVGGNLVLLEKMDNTQLASVDVAIGKAKTANNFRRSTKVMEEAIAGGGAALRMLAVPGIFPVEGGEPIIVDGKIVGGIGVSGMQPGQDGEVVRAAIASLK
jgi:glc operon protein GlcG